MADLTDTRSVPSSLYIPARHAELLAAYCLDAQPGQRVQVSATTLALPLLEALNRELLTRGARPVLRIEYPEQLDDFYRYASDDLIDQLHPADLYDMGANEATLRILTPQDSVADSRPERRARHARALAPLAQLRSQRRWSLTLYPTLAGAQAAGMTLPEYEDFVARAMFLDQPDPVSGWVAVRERQAHLIERLSRADVVRIVGPETDLTLRVGGRTWANSDGKRNMPSGEVFTGPHEDSAEGHIYYALPTMVGGRTVSGIRLTFQAGRVVQASAEVGEDVLLSSLNTDAGARLLGELGIGTNYGIQTPSRNILFDEKIGGTVHLALGKSYPETGGVNASALHWDMICDLRGGGEILLDGEVFQRGGQFV
ncbi:aminopeptidase [Deinococcus aquiradiocola]|uniref:Aminopeptidase n=1 Tax=Deinococcus aquiradiocola TaxID=393059 RepID=A0A917UTK4_9DEIO|nr:aminopeptidase [Deinococcus aquiradiocola]GGJ84851.1 aminopeptidase [Deinococcus aquiradiocola]